MATGREESEHPRLPLAIDQLVVIVAQMIAFAMFFVFGEKADQALAGQMDLVAYRANDGRSGIAFGVAAVLWVYGVGRAVQRRSGWQIAAFALALPVLLGAVMMYRRIL